LSLPNDLWNAFVAVREVQDGYDPAAGFVDRRGYRLFNPDVRRTLHTDRHPIVRRVSWEVGLSQYYDLDGRLETRTLDVQLARVQLQAGDLLEYHLRPLYERLPRDFQISQGVVLPAGAEYSFLRRRFQMQSATRRPVSLNATYEDGAFYSGTRRQLTGTLSVRPHRGWLVNVGADYNQVALAEGRFVTRVWLNDVNTQFNPFVSLVNRIQYDTVTRQLGWQSRFRWITSPGNDIFIVYTHNWIELGPASDFAPGASADREAGPYVRDTRTTSGMQTLDRRGSVKIVRTLRF
jgi:hypothetical protein